MGIDCTLLTIKTILNLTRRNNVPEIEVSVIALLLYHLYSRCEGYSPTFPPHPFGVEGNLVHCYWCHYCPTVPAPDHDKR